MNPNSVGKDTVQNVPCTGNPGGTGADSVPQHVNGIAAGKYHNLFREVGSYPKTCRREGQSANRIGLTVCLGRFFLLYYIPSLFHTDAMNY